MLSGEGAPNLETAPYLAIFPGLAISIVVLGLNMLGDALPTSGPATAHAVSTVPHTERVRAMEKRTLGRTTQM